MAVRQYIGARYVTKIYENSLDPSSAEWESNVTYEPLTMVTYNNSSYLSKKDVPGSVGNPAANPSYWVVTGAYNGQIMQLQNDIQSIIDNEVYANIVDFGAESGGDGAANATALSQALATGKSVYVPAGVFEIAGNASYTLDNDQSILCDGYLEIPESRDDALFWINNKKNLDIKLKTICQVTPSSTYKDHAHMLVLRGCEDVYVHDCEILGSMGDGVYIGQNYDLGTLNYCKNVTVARNHIANCKRNSIAVCTGELITVDGNYITSPDDGNVWNRSCVIDLEPNQDGEILKDIRIINNMIDASSNLTASLIRCNIGSTKRPDVFENITISGNNLKCYNNPSIAIYFDGNDLNGLKANKITFADNVIHGPCQEGFRIVRTRALRVSGNIIDSASSEGVLASYGAGDYIIENNTMTLTAGHGVHIRNDVGSGYVIKNNKITADNGSSDTILHEGGSNTSNLIIEGNIVEGTGTASIKILGNTDSVCAFNLLNGALVDSSTTNNEKVMNKISGTFVP